MSKEFASTIISKILESRNKANHVFCGGGLSLINQVKNLSEIYNCLKNSTNNYGKIVVNFIDENYTWHGINGLFLKYNITLHGLKLASGFFVAVMIDLDSFNFLKAKVPIFADSEGNFCVVKQFYTSVDSESIFEESLFIPSGILVESKELKNVGLVLLVYINELNSFVLSKVVKLDAYLLNENISLFNVAYTNQQENLENQELSELEESIVKLTAAVIMADNVTKPEEMNVVRDFFEKLFGNKTKKFTKLRSLLKSFAIEKPSIKQACENLVKVLSFNERLVILALLLSIATSDGDLQSCEIKIIDDIRKMLEIPQDNFDKMVLDFNPTDYKYYKILGLEPGSDFESIKNAWVQKSKLYNPEKIESMPRAFKTFAINEYQKINEAYQYFVKKFNKN